MQNLVTLVSHVISGASVTPQHCWQAVIVTLLAPLSYLSLPPLHNTFFTIKTCHLYSYGVIFCTRRKNDAFLSSFSIVPEQFYY